MFCFGKLRGFAGSAWLTGVMNSNSNRALLVSLSLTLGLMVAPLGASEPGEPAAGEPAAGETVACETTTACEATVCDAGAKVEATKADTCVEKCDKAAKVEACVVAEKTNAEIVAEARVSRAHASRAKGAKNIREWFKFAFGKSEGEKFDKEFYFTHSTPTKRAESRRAWLEFAFGGSE